MDYEVFVSKITLQEIWMIRMEIIELILIYKAITWLYCDRLNLNLNLIYLPTEQQPQRWRRSYFAFGACLQTCNYSVLNVYVYIYLNKSIHFNRRFRVSRGHADAWQTCVCRAQVRTVTSPLGTQQRTLSDKCEGTSTGPHACIWENIHARKNITTSYWHTQALK